MSVAMETPAGRPVRSSALARLTLTEFRLFVREPGLLVWGIAVPVLLLVIFGNIPVFKDTLSGSGGLTLLEVFVPTIILFTLMVFSFLAMPTVLAGYREQGILRRLQTTPAGAWRVLTAQLVVSFGSAVVMVALILVLGRLAFGVPFPLAPGIWVVIALLTAVTLLAIGLLAAAVAPTQRWATAIGALLLYPGMFFSGMWVPIPKMPAVLQHISHATPPGAAWESFQNAALGHWPPALAVGTMAGYALVAAAAAARLFRWE
jgi:ABC-2 type transport system permease protein